MSLLLSSLGNDMSVDIATFEKQGPILAVSITKIIA